MDARCPGRWKRFDKLAGALVAWRHGRHDRHAEDLAQPPRVDSASSLLQLVEHVQDQHHRPAPLGELQGQQKRAAKVFGVRHLHDHRIAVLLQQLHRHPGIVASRLEVVDSGGVDDLCLATVEARPGANHLDGGAGIVRDGDVPMRQVLEENALADVRIAEKKSRSLLFRALPVVGDDDPFVASRAMRHLPSFQPRFNLKRAL